MAEDKNVFFKPEDEFKLNDISLGLNVVDFWKYMYSDLNSDPRDDVAEFLVSNALGIKTAMNRQDWTLYDIEYRGLRIEVKCTGYYQTWRTDGKVSNQRTFSIRKATDRKCGLYERHNDIYVFCLLTGKTREEANPLVLENWEFYVVPTSVINHECGNNKSISLSRIKNMGYESVSYEKLKKQIQLEGELIGMKKALNILTKHQLKFICEECNLSQDELFGLNEEDVYNKVYDVMCDIEVYEVMESPEKDTPRCAIASDIVTILGNAMAHISWNPEDEED